ncbi:MAG: hypothetical protein J5525_00275 [Lachnospiraceae bacterium]|nr:hypothetical protein [Lachnospiraceae bacterium]
MKRSLIIVFLLLSLGLLASCGKKEEVQETEEENLTLSDQVYFNIKKKPVRTGRGDNRCLTKSSLFFI